MSLNRMKIRTKILAFSMVIVLIGVAALGVTISNTMQISASAKVVAEGMTESNHLVEFQKALSEKKVAERDFLLTGNPAFLEIREHHEEEAREQLEHAIESAIGHEQDLLQDLRTQLDEEEGFHEVVEHYQAGEQEEAIELFTSSNSEASHGEHQDGSNLAVDEVVSQVLSSNDQQLESTIMISVISAMVAVVFATGAGLVLSRYITSPILQLRDIADKVSLGDLNFENTVNAQDEIGELSDSFDRMVTAVRFLMTEDSEAEEEIAHATV